MRKSVGLAVVVVGAGVLGLSGGDADRRKASLGTAGAQPVKLVGVFVSPPHFHVLYIAGGALKRYSYIPGESGTTTVLQSPAPKETLGPGGTMLITVGDDGVRRWFDHPVHVAPTSGTIPASAPQFVTARGSSTGVALVHSAATNQTRLIQYNVKTGSSSTFLDYPGQLNVQVLGNDLGIAFINRTTLPARGSWYGNTRSSLRLDAIGSPSCSSLSKTLLGCTGIGRVWLVPLNGDAPRPVASDGSPARIFATEQRVHWLMESGTPGEYWIDGDRSAKRYSDAVGRASGETDAYWAHTAPSEPEASAGLYHFSGIGGASPTKVSAAALQ